MTREEHLKWCKDRAMEYVRSGDLSAAVSSMLSDLRKHPETRDSGTGATAQLGLAYLMRGPTRDEITKYIQGFN